MSANAETLERQAAKLIPELWSLSLNKKLDKSGVGMKIVNKIYEKISKTMVIRFISGKSAMLPSLIIQRMNPMVA